MVFTPPSDWQPVKIRPSHGPPTHLGVENGWLPINAVLRTEQQGRCMLFRVVIAGQLLLLRYDPLVHGWDVQTAPPLESPSP
jgi:hypothetical protein